MSDGDERDPGSADVLGSRRFRRRAPVVSERDFRRPARPSGERLRAVEDLAARFAARMQTALASYLRLPVRGEALAPEFTTYGGVLRELAANDWLIPLKNAAGERAVLAIDAALQVFLVNKVLGATAANVEADSAAPGAAPLGPISRAALALYLHGLLRGLNAVLAEREAGAAFEIDEVRRSGARDRYLRAADSVVAIGVRLGEPQREGQVRLLLPAGAVAQPAAPEEPVRPAAPDPAARKELEGLVRAMRVDVAVDLGRAEIDLAEYMKLAAGDVLVLSQRVNQALPVLVGGSVKFLASPGRAGSRLAVRVVRRVEEQEAT